MLKLGERNFMNDKKKINPIVDLVFGICLLTALMLVTNNSLLVYLTSPIVLSLIGLSRSFKAYVLVFLGSSLLGLIFTDLESIIFNGLAVLLISLTFIFLIRSNLSDRNKIGLGFVLIGIILTSSYKYAMVSEGLTIEAMANELKQAFEGVADVNLTEQTLRASIAMYPAIITSISMLYSILAFKLIKNYLAYKGLSKDLDKINSMRIGRKEFLIIIGLAIVAYGIFSLLGFNSQYVILNIIWIVLSILLLNGLTFYDYILSMRPSSFMRLIQRILVVVLFYFFAVFFILIGLVDVFLDLRKKIGGRYEIR